MSMQLPGTILGFALIAVVAGCHSDRSVEPGGDESPQDTPITTILASAPSTATAAIRSPAAGFAFTAEATYTYVSAAPGSISAATVSVRNRTRDRELGPASPIEILVTDGGFDPIPVAASADDTLQVEVRATDRTVLQVGYVVVPRVRPPTIVRTSPRSGKRDVPLNSRVEIVFSEPLDSGTITPQNIQVTAGGVVVAGTLLRATEFTVEFVPAEPLLPETSYSIAVGIGVRSVSGLALPYDFNASFETGSASSPEVPSCAAGGACFAFARGGAVFTTSLDDAPPALLLDNATRPQWSRDGAKIAFTRSDRYTLAKWEVCIADHDGTHVRCAVGGEDGVVVGGPSWSSDGTYVAFSVFVYSCANGGFCGQLGGDFSSVKLLDTRTMQVTSVGTHRVMSLAWSPDGRKIAFAAFGTGPFGRGGLFVMDRDGSNLGYVGQSMGSYSVVAIAWSPDGNNLALALNDEHKCPWYCDTALGVMGADGTGLNVLAAAHTSFPGKSSDRYINFPAWSADGSRLAYTLSGDCYESEPDCPTEIRGWNLKGGDSYVLVPNAAAGSWHP